MKEQLYRRIEKEVYKIYFTETVRDDNGMFFDKKGYSTYTTEEAAKKDYERIKSLSYFCSNSTQTCSMDGPVKETVVKYEPISEEEIRKLLEECYE